MNRLRALLAGRGERTLVVPYLTAGFPAREETLELLLALERGGADAIEVGLPFSDPLADGPVIQSCSQRALEGGVTHGWILEAVAGFRKRSEIPLILMGYLNPILAYGPDRFFADAADAGADGLIVPDAPPEEAAPHLPVAERAGLSWIFLAAPTSTDRRLREIDARSTDLNYCVSVAGVTGARDALPDSVVDYLARAEHNMDKPFVVGFGIARPEHVRQVSPPAAGVVVGSALLQALARETTADGRRRRAASFIESLRD